MNKCQLDFKDFKRAFEFGKNYYMDPTKDPAGRTSKQPRGLGSVLDDFTLGKLAEIGVGKILENINGNKKYSLDFEIKPTKNAKDEPDIIEIEENGNKRSPLAFVEIKSTGHNDKWVGLTKKQFRTMRENAGDRKIYMIYAKIDNLDNNSKVSSLTGMFLKQIEDKSKSSIFQGFADLNAECKIEFILSSDDLNKFGFSFNKGMSMYETELFNEEALRKVTYVYCGFKEKGGKRGMKGVTIFEYPDGDHTLEIKEKGRKPKEKEISSFSAKGEFNLIHKKNAKINTQIIECLSNVDLESSIFGKFSLEKGKFYSFNLKTLIELRQDNMLIAKKRIDELLEAGELTSPEEYIKAIARDI